MDIIEEAKILLRDAGFTKRLSNVTEKHVDVEKEE